jgi:hypothetical protein
MEVGYWMATVISNLASAGHEKAKVDRVPMQQLKWANHGIIVRLKMGFSDSARLNRTSQGLLIMVHGRLVYVKAQHPPTQTAICSTSFKPAKMH